MTTAPRAPRLAFNSIDAAIVAVRQRGLRLSTAPPAAGGLFAAEGPVSAERLAGALNMDATSVYRNLEMFEQNGLVGHVHLGHGPGLYALVGRGQREYLYCDRCGAVEAVAPDRLNPVRVHVRRLFGYETHFTHFPIVGLCPRCARDSARHPAHPKSKGTMSDDVHSHEHPHSHEHSHDGVTHAHPHTSHDHEHTEHEHEHSHGDHVHSHPHAHEKGLEAQHDHTH